MRKVMAVGVVALLGLFGFYYMKNQGGGTAEEKAKSALQQVADKVRDTGLASLVKTKLVANFGEKARFLHVFYDEGTVVVYGLYPATLTSDEIYGIASKVRGVETCQVIVSPLPEVAAPAPTPAPADPPATTP